LLSPWLRLNAIISLSAVGEKPIYEFTHYVLGPAVVCHMVMIMCSSQSRSTCCIFTVLCICSMHRVFVPHQKRRLLRPSVRPPSSNGSFNGKKETQTFSTLFTMPSLATDPPRADAGGSLSPSVSYCPGCQKRGVPLLQCDDPTPTGEKRARCVVLPLDQYICYVVYTNIDIFMADVRWPTLRSIHHSTRR
jgi:hypothetical protein